MAYNYYSDLNQYGPQRSGSYKSNVPDADAKENVLLGTLGALLFALGGGVAWILISQIGFIAGIAGLLTVFLATTGYKKFGKKLTKRGIIICIIVSIIVILIAWFVSLTIDVLTQFRYMKQNGEIDNMPSFIQAAALGVAELMDNSAYAIENIGQLVIGLVFCVFSSIFYLRSKFQQVKSEKAAQAQQDQVVATYDEPVDVVYVDNGNAPGVDAYADFDVVNGSGGSEFTAENVDGIGATEFTADNSDGIGGTGFTAENSNDSEPGFDSSDVNEEFEIDKYFDRTENI